MRQIAKINVYLHLALIVILFLQSCRQHSSIHYATVQAAKNLNCPDSIRDDLFDYRDFKGTIYSRKINIAFSPKTNYRATYNSLLKKIDSCYCIKDVEIFSNMVNQDSANLILDLLVNKSFIKKIELNKFSFIAERFKKVDTINIEDMTGYLDIDSTNLSTLILNSDSLKYLIFHFSQPTSLSKENNLRYADSLLSHRNKILFDVNLFGPKKQLEYVEIKFVNIEKYFFKDGNLVKSVIDTPSEIRHR